MGKIKLLVYAVGTISAGEITIALGFTNRLDKKTYEITYMIPEHYSNLIPEDSLMILLDTKNNSSNNKQIILDFIENYNPNYILLADMYTAHFASSWTGINFDTIKSFGIPIIGLDEYGYYDNFRDKDYYGGLKTRSRDLINECEFIIQDIPINKIGIQKQNVWGYSLYGKEQIDNKYHTSENFDKKNLFLKEMGISDDKKLVVIPTSTWEVINMHRLPILDGFLQNCIKLVINYVNYIYKDAVIVHIGKEQISKWALDSSLDYGIEYINYPKLESQTYNRFIDMADLFITFNAVSVSLSRAVLNKVPAIAFYNPLVINYENLSESLGKLPNWYGKIANEIGIAYPFQASTFGWNQFLNPLIENNPYYDLFLRAPIFSFSKSIESIALGLNREKYNLKFMRKIDKYIEALARIKSPNEIMMEIRGSIN